MVFNRPGRDPEILSIKIDALLRFLDKNLGNKLPSPSELDEFQEEVHTTLLEASDAEFSSEELSEWHLRLGYASKIFNNYPKSYEKMAGIEISTDDLVGCSLKKFDIDDLVESCNANTKTGELIIHMIREGLENALKEQETDTD